MQKINLKEDFLNLNFSDTESEISIENINKELLLELLNDIPMSVKRLDLKSECIDNEVAIKLAKFVPITNIQIINICIGNVGSDGVSALDQLYGVIEQINYFEDLDDMQMLGMENDSDTEVALLS